MIVLHQGHIVVIGNSARDQSEEWICGVSGWLSRVSLAAWIPSIHQTQSLRASVNIELRFDGEVRE